MPFGSYETPKPTPKPTFLQYIKSAPKNIESKTKFGVEIIFLPGKFDNITLQTHAFRYIVDKDHPLYADIQEYMETVSYDVESPRLDITIDSLQERRISVSFSARKSGLWERLGTSVCKFKE